MKVFLKKDKKIATKRNQSKKSGSASASARAERDGSYQRNPSVDGSAIHQRGFTIMEIVVATTIFALVTVSMTTLFNYTLKINRRAEAIRQATQGMRDFTETMVKEVRNGQIDYGVLNGATTYASGSGNCNSITPIGAPYPNTNGASTYNFIDNRLGIVDTEGNRECFFLGDKTGAYVGSGT